MSHRPILTLYQPKGYISRLGIASSLFRQAPDHKIASDTPIPIAKTTESALEIDMQGIARDQYNLVGLVCRFLER